MRLPDSFLDELRSRLSLSQVVGRKVSWDLKKSNQGKGDWWAPCPFHQEKTASFHVDDRKGFYYCFGCQAKGNLFGFVQETENVSFMEAVEILATEAGMQMPARDPKAAERADRASQLREVVEQAQRWFRLQLKTNAAAGARDYLKGRGLDGRDAERFGLGFAPDASDALLTHLREAGVEDALIEGAGLMVPAEEGRAARDRFIHRIIFPIRDARDRTIAFGGRAMNPNARAKYLNSPETELFDKGANLYNLGPARAAAGKGQPLIVAEGYMDVIALVRAGFEAAVAPLGTAVTEGQLRLLWRLSPEPVVALDGDAAGQRAGLRVADLALPLIEAGQSLRFAILPEGLDPDDLIRSKGSGAMADVIGAARSMLDLLWARETGGRDFDSPERRATLDRDLRALVRRVKDASLRGHYAREVARRRAELFGYDDAPAASAYDGPYAPGPDDGWRDDAPDGPPPDMDRWDPVPDHEPDPGPPPGPASGPSAPVRARGGFGGRGRGRFSDRNAPAVAHAATRASLLASGGTPPEVVLEQVALAGLSLHPSLLEEFTEALERTEWSLPGHAALAAALLGVDPGADVAQARAQVHASGSGSTLETLLAQRHVAISPAVRAGAEGARGCLRDAFGKLEARACAERERREAMEDFEDGADEALTWRLAEASRRREAAQRAPREESTTTEDSEAMSDYLQGLLDTKIWEKPRQK